MRHPTQPTNHSRLIAAIVAFILCFVTMVAIQADRDNDFQIRLQLLSNRT